MSLATAVDAYVDAPGPVGRARAREAWKSAMRVWSGLELFQFGPLSSAAAAAGKDTYQGKGIRDRVYAWPLAARCRVEEQVASGKYQSTGMDTVLVSGRGLFALEYLLFYEGSDTGCTPASPTGVAWASLSPQTIAENKRIYARAVARDIATQATALRTAWDPAQGNFRAVFVSASGYPSEQEAMNVLAWALVYLEQEVKDWKLGIPAGYTLVHPVGQPESPYANIGTDDIRENMVGFRRLFQGCGEGGEGIGFDDWLDSAGHGALSGEIVAAWQAAKDVVDALPALPNASVSQLDAAYQALRHVTVPLKADFFGPGSALNLKLPATIGDDTD
jgi:predicted lipoprotein